MWKRCLNVVWNDVHRVVLLAISWCFIPLGLLVYFTSAMVYRHCKVSEDDLTLRFRYSHRMFNIFLCLRAEWFKAACRSIFGKLRHRRYVFGWLLHAGDWLGVVQILDTGLTSELLFFNQRFDRIYSVHFIVVEIVGRALIPECETLFAFNIKQRLLAVKVLLWHK